MVYPYSPSVPSVGVAQARVVRQWMRSLFLLTLGTVVFVSVDLFGVPSLRTHGPFVLYGLLLPGNVMSCATLTYATITERNLWWRVLLAISLIASVFSLAFVGLVVFGHILFMNFPGPG